MLGYVPLGLPNLAASPPDGSWNLAQVDVVSDAAETIRAAIVLITPDQTTRFVEGDTVRGGTVLITPCQTGRFEEVEIFRSGMISLSVTQNVRFAADDTFWQGSIVVATDVVLAQSARFGPDDVFAGHALGSAVLIGDAVVPSDDKFFRGTIVKGKPFISDIIGQGVLADYGRRKGMTFYKQRITVGR